MRAYPLAVPLTRSLGNSLVCPLPSGDVILAESLEFYDRASVTNAAAKTRINEFIKGLKALEIWDNLIFVTCHSDMGGLHQLGGSAQRTDTPWTTSGTHTTSDDGMVQTGSNPATYAYPNRILPAQAFSTAGVASSPRYIGIISSQDYTDSFVNTRTFAVSGPSVLNYQNLASFTGTGSYGTYYAGINSSNCYRVTYSLPEIFADRNRPFLQAVWLRGNLNYARNLVNGQYDAGATTTTYDHAVYANFGFANGATTGNNGKIHGLFLWYGDPESLGRTKWQRFWALINSTLFSAKRTGGFLRVQISGQSNASAALSKYLNRDNLGKNGERCSEVHQANTGGVPITNWVGTGTPARAAGYVTDFWAGDGTKTLEQSRPLNGIGTWREWMVWIQGESDSETRDLVNNYKTRLEALISFWREDTGNAGMKILIGKIGYHYAYRSNTTIGNFTASGATGGNTVLNGDWVITTMTTALEDYVWTKAGYTLIRQNSRWEFVRDSDSAVMLASSTDTEHPALATWGGSITIGDSRTGRIEEIRKIQQEVADADPLAESINMKNFEYNIADQAHMTTAGYQSFAAAISAIVTA